MFDILAPVLKFFKLNSYAYQKKSFAKCKTWVLKVSKLIPHVLWKIHVPVLHTKWLKKKCYSVIRIEVVHETVRVW